MIDWFPPFHDGGDGILAQSISEALVGRGHQVSVLTKRKANRLSHPNDIDWYTSDYDIYDLSTIDYSILQEKLKLADVIHAHQITNKEMLDQLPFLSSVPLVFHCHIDFASYNKICSEPDYDAKAYIEMQRWMLDRSQLIVCHSNLVRKSIICQGIQQENIRLIDPIVDSNFNRNSSKKPWYHDGKFIIAIGGRLDDPMKGFSEAVHAISLLQKKHSNYIKVIIIGTLTDKQRNEAVIKIGHNVEFCGWVSDRNTMVSILSQAHVILSLSKSETYGMMVFEAVHLGIVPIITNVGEMAKKINEESLGIVLQAEPNNVASISRIAAETLYELSINTEQWLAYSKSCKRYCLGIKKNSNVDQIENILMNVQPPTPSTNDFINKKEKDKETNITSKFKLLFADFVIWENVCNLKCNYCNNEVEKKTQLLARTTTDEIIECLNLIKKCSPPAVLKLSGGELSCLGEKCLEICKYAADSFMTVQILTNGIAFPTKYIHELNKIENVFFQFSLDGHTLSMNSCRYKSLKQLNNVIKAIKIAASAKPVEINTVITKYNCEQFIAFVKFIADTINLDTIIYPFPVRGYPDLLPSSKQVIKFKHFYETLNKKQNLLPNHIYMRSLIDFLFSRGRTTPCYIPWMVRGFYDTGDVQLCPCEDIMSLGNLHRDYSEVNSFKYLKKITKPKEVIHPKCLNCFTHYDAFNPSFCKKKDEIFIPGGFIGELKKEIVEYFNGLKSIGVTNCNYT